MAKDDDANHIRSTGKKPLFKCEDLLYTLRKVETASRCGGLFLTTIDSEEDQYCRQLESDSLIRLFDQREENQNTWRIR